MIGFDALKTYKALLENFTPAQAEALVDVMRIFYGRQADSVSCVGNVDPVPSLAMTKVAGIPGFIWMGSAMLLSALGQVALIAWLLLR